MQGVGQPRFHQKRSHELATQLELLPQVSGQNVPRENFEAEIERTVLSGPAEVNFLSLGPQLPGELRQTEQDHGSKLLPVPTKGGQQGLNEASPVRDPDSPFKQEPSRSGNFFVCSRTQQDAADEGNQ